MYIKKQNYKTCPPTAKRTTQAPKPFAITWVYVAQPTVSSLVTLSSLNQNPARYAKFL